MLSANGDLIKTRISVLRFYTEMWISTGDFPQNKCRHAKSATFSARYYGQCGVKFDTKVSSGGYHLVDKILH